MALTDAELRKILVDESYLSEEDMKRAEEHATQAEIPLKMALFDLALLTQELYEGAIAEYFKLPYRNLQTNPPAAETLALLPEEIARAFCAIIVERAGNIVTVATSDPSRPMLEDAIRMNVGQETAAFPKGEGSEQKPEEKKVKKGLSFSFGRKAAQAEARTDFSGDIHFEYAAQSAIEALLAHYRKPLATRFQAIIDEKKTVAPEILDEIINDAIDLRASDIHFEPQEKSVTVRFRVDGVMHEAGRIPKEHYEGIVNRIKIESNMRIDEHYAAQDGAIRYSSRGEAMDIRVSIVPLVDGEKVVMRLLSAYIRTITLADLGFTPENQRILEDNAKKPFGMILTVGPTGSGKSTTLYALMKMRNHPDVNISTIEDPVEYKMPGINHIQVNPKTDLTFAKGLRALVRQDPDIVLVGEIRDGETADIAVNAALTGHLLFSTLHANDAATAIPRLLEMGVEPFLLASTLEVVVAQRLMRRLCPQCRYSEVISREDITKIYAGAADQMDGKDTMLVYRGKGCEACGGTGYRGRVGIHEMMVMTPEIEALIIRSAPTNEINNEARRGGMKVLFEDGFEKVKRGITSIEELLRVAAAPEPLPPTEPHGKAKK